MKKGMKMNVLIIIAICIIFNIIGQLSLKKGMVTIGKTSVADFFTGKFFTIIFNYYVFFGLMLYGIGSFLWLVVLSKADLSFAYSLLAVGYIAIGLLSWYFFKEPLTAVKLTGMSLVTVGVFLILMKV
ncbi:MAG: transporter [Candidatus Aenigmarchaeota archaeon]|nr:transporter [Candidatus Aenigmarchaeota archaeon]